MYMYVCTYPHLYYTKPTPYFHICCSEKIKTSYEIKLQKPYTFFMTFFAMPLRDASQTFYNYFEYVIYVPETMSQDKTHTELHG